MPEPILLCGCEGIPCDTNSNDYGEHGRQCGSCGQRCHPYIEDE